MSTYIYIYISLFIYLFTKTQRERERETERDRERERERERFLGVEDYIGIVNFQIRTGRCIQGQRIPNWGDFGHWNPQNRDPIAAPG